MLHTRDIKGNRQQENSKFSYSRYHIQDFKNDKHKNVNIYWDYQKFPRNPVDAEKFETRGINTILLYYHYRVDLKLGKCVCAIFGFHVHVQAVLIDLIIISYQIVIHNLNQGIPVLKWLL